jgi:hypothetical protein
MGYTRQGVAIALILAGLANADEKSTTMIILYILAARCSTEPRCW